MSFKLLRLLLVTGEGDLEAEKNNIFSKAKQHLDSIQMLTDNLYECASNNLKFLLYFETGRMRTGNAIILKPMVSDTSNVSEFNLAPYIKILLKIIEDYEIYSLKSVNQDSAELPK